MLVDPESIKNTVKLQYFFTLSKSASVKAVRRTFSEIEPRFRSSRLVEISSTVKSKYREIVTLMIPKIVAVVDRWSFFRGTFMM